MKTPTIFYTTEVPNDGASASIEFENGNILWDDDTPILWDDDTNIIWSEHVSVTSERSFAFSTPKITFGAEYEV